MGDADKRSETGFEGLNFALQRNAVGANGERLRNTRTAASISS